MSSPHFRHVFCHMGLVPLAVGGGGRGRVTEILRNMMTLTLSLLSIWKGDHQIQGLGGSEVGGEYRSFSVKVVPPQGAPLLPGLVVLTERSTGEQDTGSLKY